MSFRLKNIPCFIIGAAVVVSSLLCVHGNAVKQPPASSTTAVSTTNKTTKTSTDVINELKQYLVSMNTFQANFVQTTKNDKGQKIQTSNGSTQIKRPAFFRWEIISPFPQLYISTESKMWVYDKALQQLTIRAVDKQSDTILAVILNSNVKELSQLYLAKVTGSKQKTFILTPKEKSSLFKELHLIFSAKKLSGMFMSDYLGTQTSIEFLNVKENISISDKQFTFIPPKNVDVLDETKK